MQTVNVVIIGAGAAGLMCTIAAGQRGRSVLLIEHANRVGKKILMSGGGRCNFTNLWVEPENYLSLNKHFCKSALSRFTQHDFIKLVEKHGIAYHEKTLGQLFCDNKAKDIVNMLLNECDAANVEIVTKTSVKHIKKNQNTFELQTNMGSISCQSLVIATGGLSIPSMGATGFGYQIAKQFGLNVLSTRPGLVGLKMNARWLNKFSHLSGLSIQANVYCNGQTFNEAILFTHQGLSGPAILQISNYWQKGDGITIDLLPGVDLVSTIKFWREQGAKAELKSLIAEMLPRRFVQHFLEMHHLNKPAAQYSNDEIQQVANIFHEWTVYPDDTVGYKTAEVTLGGIDTDEVSSKTFEANKVSGLYFIGEVLDVTGWLGGFNFQWAWASGYCAGQYV